MKSLSFSTFIYLILIFSKWKDVWKVYTRDLRITYSILVQNPENDDVLDPAPKSYRFHGEESKVYIDGQPIEPTKKGVDFRFIPGPNPHYDGKPIYWQKQSLAAQPDVGAFPQYYGQPRQQGRILYNLVMIRRDTIFMP